MSEHPVEPPAAALSGDVAVFSDYLRQRDADFLVLGDTGGSQVRVRFVGPFQGDAVVWDCRFVTLRHERQKFDRSVGATPGRPLRNFIDIGRPGAGGVPIRVGLDLDRIDDPAILKMILMVRNYKRLKPGRHEFGEAVPRP